MERNISVSVDEARMLTTAILAYDTSVRTETPVMERGDVELLQLSILKSLLDKVHKVRGL